jgi:uncharacterized membrane protein YkgB
MSIFNVNSEVVKIIHGTGFPINTNGVYLFMKMNIVELLVIGTLKLSTTSSVSLTRLIMLSNPSSFKALVTFSFLIAFPNTWVSESLAAVR